MLYFLGTILGLLPTYLIRFTIFDLPTTFLEIIILVFIFFVLVTKFHEISSLKKLGRLNWFILAFVLSGIISTIISPEPIKALGHLKAFIIEPILMFYAINLIVTKREDVRIPLLFLFWSAVIISIWGIIQYFTFLGLPIRFWGSGEEAKRIVSVFEFPNALSLYLGPIIAFFFVFYLKKENLVSLMAYRVGLGFMFVALFLTFSRGAWIALFLTLLFFIFHKYSWKKVLPAFLIIVFLLVLTPAFYERISLINNDSSSVAHLDLMQLGVNKIINDPIFGNGLFGFRDTLVEANYKGEILNYPHNIFLNFWLELGLLGFLAFFTVQWFILDEYKKNPTTLGLAAVAFLAVILLHGLVDVPYFKNDLAVLFWVIVSLSTIKQ
jgi:O-antigen ligase